MIFQVQQVINDQLPIIQKYDLADNIDVFCDSIGFTLDEARDILTAGKRAGMKVKAHAEQIQHTGCKFPRWIYHFSQSKA